MTMKIGLSGCYGKMNTAVIVLAKELGYQTFFIDKKDFSLASMKNFFQQPLDIFIDFSDQSFWPYLVESLSYSPLPFLSGTTGIATLDEDLLFISNLAPVVHEKNFSEGIFFLKAFLKGLDTSSYGITIEEEHHCLKKDSPSGTAIDLANLLGVHPDEISVKREKTTIGRHRIAIDLEDQELVIEHKASSRKMFARGALKMAKWLVSKPKGRYTMEQYMKEVKL